MPEKCLRLSCDADFLRTNIFMSWDWLSQWFSFIFRLFYVFVWHIIRTNKSYALCHYYVCNFISTLDTCTMMAHNVLLHYSSKFCTFQLIVSSFWLPRQRIASYTPILRSRNGRFLEHSFDDSNLQTKFVADLNWLKNKSLEYNKNVSMEYDNLKVYILLFKIIRV